jgi:hypothetical protein
VFAHDLNTYVFFTKNDVSETNNPESPDSSSEDLTGKEDKSENYSDNGGSKNAQTDDDKGSEDQSSESSKSSDDIRGGVTYNFLYYLNSYLTFLKSADLR